MYTLVKTKSNYNKWQMAKNGRNIPPGQMQYKVKPNDIISMLSTYISYNTTNEEKNWNFCSHSSENLKKLTPNTYTGKSSNWKIILINDRKLKGISGEKEMDFFSKSLKSSRKYSSELSHIVLRGILPSIVYEDFGNFSKNITEFSF